MKRKILCLLCVGVLIGNVMISNAAETVSVDNAISNKEAVQNIEIPYGENVKDLDTPYEEYIDLEKTDLNEIETDCDDIDIISVEKVEEDDITEIGISDYDPSIVEDIGESSIDTEILLGNIAIPLYPTFDDSQSAIQKVKEKCPNVLGLLADKYNLLELSDDNWMDYSNYLIGYLDEEDKEEWYSEDNDEYVKLSIFFDIYENATENNEIVSEVAEAETIVDLIESETFVPNLPSYAVEDLVENSQLLNEEIPGLSPESYENEEYTLTNMNTKISDYKLEFMAYSKSKATKYAKKYAKEINKKYGTLLNIRGKDCTNFASQILVAGGKKPNTTWYCIPSPSTNMYYSPTWCGANKFSKYWGVDYKYSSHSSFSKKLKSGDFIAYDKANDGSWDHIGYITSTAEAYSSKLGYKDYKVAQHSSNYHLWASNKSNGWDTLKSKYKNVRFGIIRM